MQRILKVLDNAVWIALAALTAVMSLAILIQVLCRVLLGTAIVWAEEFAVLLFAWMIFLGAAYGQRNDQHLSIDTLRSMLGRRAQLAMDALRLIVIAACSLVAIRQGVILTQRTMPLLYPAMEITRALLYASVPVCFAIGLVYMAADVYGRLRGTSAERDE
ncbi:MAG: TRAP-type transport system small permease protein [Hyphomicrobiales bacterium]|jgi:TRAP-type C4-dicarboxylate transport system permease small subunit